MPQTVTMVPVNVASESQRRVGIAVWRYQVGRVHDDNEARAFLAMNGFPQRIPTDQLGRLVTLLNQAGFHVEFQPMPPRGE